ncbi:8194_t:CDS:2 [Diversispora eburnea]|uniref:8194_t:CDS:1 n=1 Tax=Diversispora eburnea TaxID=1213867 RepID=A0A9N8ZYJ4_9GLOM|nr:8194_t:CDS:2 [Diversispora eburnea]
MPQEVQFTNPQEQPAFEDNKLISVTTNRNKIEKKQTKKDESSKSLKRTAPNDIVEQGDAKRKATQGSKKSVEKSVDGATLTESDSNSIEESSAALLSSTQQINTLQVTVESPPNQQLESLSSSTTSTMANSVSSPIAVDPSLSSSQSMTSPLHTNMGDFLNSSATATAQIQSQENNSSAAKECRRKKKLYVADLEEKVTRLEEENIRLHKEVEELNSKLGLCTIRTEDNVRLQKELEELKAKLELRLSQSDVKKESKTNFKGEPGKIDSAEPRLNSLKS